MKKFSALLLVLTLLLSSVCGSMSANAQSDDPQGYDGEKGAYYVSSEISNQGTVRMTAKPGDAMKVYFSLKPEEKAAGFLCELRFNKSYLGYVNYDQYYTDTFVNQVNDTRMVFSILFDAEGTSVSDDTEIIAFNFKSRNNITEDDVAVTYIIREFYNSDLTEMSYDLIDIKAVNESADSDNEPHIHSAVIHEAQAPTCTEPGWGEWAECKDCGEILVPKISVPATGHTEVIDPAVEATCTHEGKTEGSHCEICGAVIRVQQVVPMIDHNYVNGVCTMCGKKQEGYSTDSDTDTDSHQSHTDSDKDTDTAVDEAVGKLIGDVSFDGMVSSKDALIILRATIKLIDLSDTQKKLGDVNSDGNINGRDALIVQRYGIGIVSSNSKVGTKYEKK